MKRALVLTLLVGCSNPTEIVVRVQSTIAAGATFESTPTANMMPTKAGKLGFVCFNLQDVAPPAGTLIEPPKGDPSWTNSVAVGGPCPVVELAVVASGDWKGKSFGVDVTAGETCGSTTAIDPMRTSDAYLFSSGSSVFDDGRVTLLTIELGRGCIADPANPQSQCPAGSVCSVVAGKPTCAPVTTDPAPPSYTPPTSSCPVL